MKARWNGFGGGIAGASVAVAGVCLSSSVASAWTSSRDTDFETEFDLDATPAASLEPKSAGPAAEQSGQTVASYLDRLVRRAEDVDVMPECLPEKSSVGEARDAGNENATTRADVDEDAAWQAFMAALIGPGESDETSADSGTDAAPEPPPAVDAEPAESVSVAEPCCPADQAARNFAAAVRPVLEFVPFRWLAENPIEINVKLTTPAREDGARLSFFP